MVRGLSINEYDGVKETTDFRLQTAAVLCGSILRLEGPSIRTSLPCCNDPTRPAGKPQEESNHQGTVDYYLASLWRDLDLLVLRSCHCKLTGSMLCQSILVHECL